MTDSAMLTFTLRRLRASVVLLAPFVKLQRKFLRQVLAIFGGADKAPRLQALLFIRHMAAVLPAPALDLALKVTHQLLSLNSLGMLGCACGFLIIVHGYLKSCACLSGFSDDNPR